MCPDLKIAAQFKCKQTKIKCIIKNASASCYHKQLVEFPKSCVTTDVSVCKQLAFVTRIYDTEAQRVRRCHLFDLVQLDNGNAEALFHTVCCAFQ